MLKTKEGRKRGEEDFKKQRKTCNKQKRVTDLNSYISIKPTTSTITLRVNSLNVPIKRQRLDRVDKKTQL